MDIIRLERALARIMKAVKDHEEKENGPGAFEHALLRGEVVQASRRRELTSEEHAFLSAPPPSRRH